MRGDETADGKWQPCIEFESRRGIRLETCPPMSWRTPDELKHWAETLDENYRLDALTRASQGPIRKVRKSPHRTT